MHLQDPKLYEIRKFNLHYSNIEIRHDYWSRVNINSRIHKKT